MSFGQDFLKGFFGQEGVKDYAHASQTFRTNAYELSPRLKFLYYVFFNLNLTGIPGLKKVFGEDQTNIGLMVKSVQLPNYTVDIETMNQYNRKRLVQTKINYQPTQIVFNDDQGDLIRNLWYNYYSYYYKDPSQKAEGQPTTNGSIGAMQTLSNGFGYQPRDIYNPSRIGNVNDWGYIGESYNDGTAGANSQATGPGGGKPNFFNSISIYGMSQKRYASYTLINPMIKEWQHDTYDYSQSNGVMTNTVTIQYETVKYGDGAIGGTNPSSVVPGFADPSHYDTIRSNLSRPGATATVFGQGGIIDAGEGIFNDLEALASGRGGVQNIIGAVQKAGTTYNTFKGKNIRSIADLELRQAATNAARNSLPAITRQGINTANGTFFPKKPTPPTE
jgi:hypothetical protein